MTVIKIMGREFTLAPFMLDQMIEAAPFVDAQQARQLAIAERAGVQFLADDDPDSLALKAHEIARNTTLSETMATIADAVRVIHIGIRKIDPTVTIEQLFAAVEPTAEVMTTLLTAMRDVLRTSGMSQGEAPAPAQADTPAA